MKASIDQLVQTVRAELASVESRSLVVQVREAIGAGPMVAAAQARDAIWHFAEDPLVSDEIRRYAAEQHAALPRF
ncbi:hypothetical protein [Roseateles depolymerans]|uniref:Uncharacterized protein n=1 Tax=Roseateles depolymerans TaxID=76731 RepID=A0A0U3L8U1_9BURK|nr:hypothetical protein [Roseateles depolymerans]ALV07726.1 hypothetical protein RD2015_3268 [Roseateles depolymerans]REG22050.1 hypothetical protein DES44_1192 [Roseateles depolymerans]